MLGIVGIVLALTVPKLGAARARTQEIKSIANLRTHAQTLTVYAGDNEEVPPYITDPAASWTVIRGGGVSVVVDYFGLFCTWNVALADAYFGGEVLNDALVVPWMQARSSWPYTHYFYSENFISRPDYWNYATRRVDRSQWRSTRLSEPSFPSMKGIVLENDHTDASVSGTELRGQITRRFALVDGAARGYLDSETTRPYLRGAGSFPAPSLSVGGGRPVRHTIGGVLGRDTR